MLNLLNAMDLMHAPSSNALPSLPPLCRAYSPSPTVLSARSKPPASQGSCHPGGSVSSRTRSRSGTTCSHGSHPLPDDDVVVYRDRLNTDGDPEFDPRAAAKELEGRRISPIGSRRGAYKTRPSSPAVSQPAYFPPPGLVKGEPPSAFLDRPMTRAASAPPSMYPQLFYSTPLKRSEYGCGDFLERRLAHLSLREFEDKFVALSQFRKPPKDNLKDNRPNPWDKSGPFNRKLGDVLRERPYFGSYACPIECTGSRCANCAFLRFGGNLLAAKIGQRITNARLLRVTPRSDWPYVEDKRAVLALRESYRRGSERALAELSVLN